MRYKTFLESTIVLTVSLQKSAVLSFGSAGNWSFQQCKPPCSIFNCAKNEDEHSNDVVYRESIKSGNIISVLLPAVDSSPQGIIPVRKHLPNYVKWKVPTVDKANNQMQLYLSSFTDKLEMQTAITTFSHPDFPKVFVELHAQIHYADKEYYDHYNSDEFNSDDVVAVLYELLIDEDLLEDNYQGQHCRRVIQMDTKKGEDVTLLRASVKDQNTARKYGWTCQVDGIDYTTNTNKYQNWIHADFTRQELLINKLEKETRHKYTRNEPGRTLQHLLQPVGTTAEAATALLMGPPMVLQSQQMNRRERRIFTNLFLSGDSFAVVLRWALWLTVPCPELSILLLDSSSIWLETDANPGDKWLISKKTGLISGLSPVVIPMAKALVAGQIQTFQKMLFGQVVVGTNAVLNPNDDESNFGDWDVLVNQRNDKALLVLKNEIDARKYNNSNKNAQGKYVLLYGCSHCPDIHQKLVRLGYQPVETTWRTAWSVEFQQDSNESMNGFILSLGLILVLYLSIGAMDWIGTINDFLVSVRSWDGNNDGPIEGLTELLFYLIRHTLLYVSLSRISLDWKKV